MCAVCYNMLCVPCMFVWQSVLCDQEHLSTLEVDMALLSVSRLTCGSWSLEWNIVLTLSLLTQHIVYQLCWWVVHVSDQSCFFMQDWVSERNVQFTEVEQTLSGMGRLKKLVLGIGYRIGYDVSVRWYNVVVTNCTSALVQGM